MALGGKWGYTPPAWVALIQVAKWLGVPPWELAQAPSMWRDRASAVMDAEAHAAEIQRRQG